MFGKENGRRTSNFTFLRQNCTYHGFWWHSTLIQHISRANFYTKKRQTISPNNIPLPGGGLRHTKWYFFCGGCYLGGLPRWGFPAGTRIHLVKKKKTETGKPPKKANNYGGRGDGCFNHHLSRSERSPGWNSACHPRAGSGAVPVCCGGGGGMVAGEGCWAGVNGGGDWGGGGGGWGTWAATTRGCCERRDGKWHKNMSCVSFLLQVDVCAGGWGNKTRHLKTCNAKESRKWKKMKIAVHSFGVSQGIVYCAQSL